MTISVVMTTYNGSQFVVEQLDSLKKQTKKIDEVLIFDDCSKDETVSIVADYISQNNLNGWKIFRNEQNKGYNRNFLEGALVASGDIIFYCDQDDIWDETKIEKVSATFNNPNVMVCAHRDILFNTNGTNDYNMLNHRGGGTIT